MGLGPIPRSAIMNYAAECGLDDDAAEQFARIIRDVDVEFLRTSNATKSDKNKVEEVAATDVEGVKQIFNRLATRSAAANRKTTKPDGKS